MTQLKRIISICLVALFLLPAAMPAAAAAPKDAKKPTYTVTFDTDNGAISVYPDSISALAGSSVILPKPAKPYTVTCMGNNGIPVQWTQNLNCAFLYWEWETVNDAGETVKETKKAGESFALDANVTMTAVWKEPYPDSLETPTRDGYAFLGWATDPKAETPDVTFATEITSDMTLYAVWKLTTSICTLTLDPQGGTVARDTLTGPEATSVRLPEPTKTYTVSFNANGGVTDVASKTVKCVCTGWFTAASGNAPHYAPGSSYTLAAKQATLYARWAEPAIGELPVPVRSGYAFQGWSMTADGAPNVTKDSIVHANTTLYAVWKEDPSICVVTLQPEGGEVTPMLLSGKIGESTTLPVPTKKYNTVTFDGNGGTPAKQTRLLQNTCTGWYTAPAGAAETFEAGGSYTFTGDSTLYARWDAPVLGALPAAKRSGYTLRGWSETPNGEADDNAAEKKITEDITMYAVWEETVLVYTVTLQAEGGEVSPSALTGKANTAYTLPTPTKAFTVTFDGNGGTPATTAQTKNCTCIGWYSAREGDDVTSYAAGEEYTLTQNGTLYARWDDPVLGMMPAASRDGYFFRGWSTTKDGASDVTEDTVVSSDMTLYAVWEDDVNTAVVMLEAEGGTVTPDKLVGPVGTKETLPTPIKKITITFNGNGGAADKSKQTTESVCTGWYESREGSATSYAPGDTYTLTKKCSLYARWDDPAIGELPGAVRKNHLFAGWSTRPAGPVDVTKNSIFAADTTLYAVWVKNDATSTLTLHAQGGAVSPDSLSGKVGSEVILPTPTKTVTITFLGNGGTPVKQSKTTESICTGWYTTPTGEAEKRYGAGEAYTLLLNDSLYARWIDLSVGKLPGEEGSDLLKVARDGYVLLGWSTAPDGDVDVTNDTSFVTNTTLYAVWGKKPTTCFVTLYPEGGKLGGSTEPQKLNGLAGTTTILPVPTWTYTIKFDGNGGVCKTSSATVQRICNGWYTAHQGEADRFETGKEYTFTQTCSLFARWDDATFGTLVNETPVRRGYVFEGWATSANSKVFLSSEDKISNNMTVYAIWSVDPDWCFVTLHPEGGSVSPTELVEKKGTTQLLPFPTKTSVVTLDGNGGKFTESNGVKVKMRQETVRSTFIEWVSSLYVPSAKRYKGGDIYTFEENGDLYARWTDPTYGAMLDQIPQRDGYEFTGWYTEPFGGEKIEGSFLIHQDAHIYAHWASRPQAISCVISSLPRKLVYNYQETERDYSGITLYVRYSNGSAEYVSDLSKMEFSEFSTQKPVGTKHVTVTYNGAQAKFDVRVRYAWWQWLILIFLLGFLWY